jgi:hypothetical protein
MRAVLLLSILAVTAYAGFEKPLNFYALLAPSDATYSGFGGCGFQYDTTTMMLVGGCNFFLMPGDSGTAAHIHGPTASPGTGTADPLFTISSTGMSPIAWQSSAALTNDQEAALFTAKLYVNVHTTQKSGGAISGFLINQLPDNWIAAADGLQSKVSPPSTYMAGVAVSKGATAGAYKLTVIHNVPTSKLTACHLHSPSSGPGNSTLAQLVPIGASNLTCASPILQKDITLTSIQESYLKQGLMYYNLHTTTFPAGEIRGQLNAIWKLTQPMRGAASSVTVGVPVILAAIVALFALRV